MHGFLWFVETTLRALQVTRRHCAPGSVMGEGYRFAVRRRPCQIVVAQPSRS